MRYKYVLFDLDGTLTDSGEKEIDFAIKLYASLKVSVKKSAITQKVGKTSKIKVTVK